MKINPIVFLIGVVLVGASLPSCDIARHDLIRNGSKAPNFKVRNLEGKDAALSDFRGRLVFLNFCRTDCTPCIAEMPDLEVVSRAFKERKFQMMPVSLDVDEEDVFRFYREHKLTMPSYLDSGESVSAKLQITGTPEIFLIDKEGKVIRYYILHNDGQARRGLPRSRS